MPTNLVFEANLRTLREKYPHAAISAIDAGREIGYSSGRAYNLMAEGRFPLPLLAGGQKFEKKRVSVVALALFLSGLAEPEPEVHHNSITVADLEIKRRPGRPTNAERLARAQLVRDPHTVDFVNGNKCDGEMGGAK